MRIKYVPLLKLALGVWVVLWVNFMIRDLTKGGGLKEYKVLLSRDAIGKASYVYGDRLFEFIKFSKENLPATAAYDTAGTELSVRDSADSRRVVYYLYPHMKVSGAEYLLAFDMPGYTRPGYDIFKAMDDRRFILQKRAY